jgi:Helix-turn-helix domain
MRGVCNSPRPYETIMAMQSQYQTTEPVYLQTPAAAARLGLAPATLEKMRVRGDGPPFCRWSRRRIVYAVAAIDQWAREREYRSTEEYSAAAA